MAFSPTEAPSFPAAPPLEADIICKVIDNYGDAGVVLRLARGLSRLTGDSKAFKLRIFTDQPEIFARMGMSAGEAGTENPEVPGSPLPRPDTGIQVLGLADWDLPPEGWDGQPARVVIQAFDAPLPEFYRQALSAPQTDGLTGDAKTLSPEGNAGIPHLSPLSPDLVSPPSDVPRDHRRLLINLEYLSAEEWTVEYHLLPSLSGITGVDKIFFLPGFRPGTGGLIWSETPPPTNLRKHRARKEIARLLADLPANGTSGENPTGLTGLAVQDPMAGKTQFWLSLFSYEHDYSDLVAALAALSVPGAGGPRGDLADTIGSPGEPVVFLAPGRSAQGFLGPWEKAGKPFRVITLPFLTQENYDLLVDACDFNLVRGEESLARAALSGTPFLWHAYLQEDRHQLVKVQALLEVMKSCFDEADHRFWESAFLSFNDRETDLPPPRSSTDWQGLLRQATRTETRAGFSGFARQNAASGDLSAHILKLTAGFPPTRPDRPV